MKPPARRAPSGGTPSTEIKWISPARLRTPAALFIQEIGALLFGLVFLFLWRESRVVYFGLWSIAWLLRCIAALFGYELLQSGNANWLAPYAVFEFGFAIVLVKRGGARGIRVGHQRSADGAAADHYPPNFCGADLCAGLRVANGGIPRFARRGAVHRVFL